MRQVCWVAAAVLAVVLGPSAATAAPSLYEIAPVGSSTTTEARAITPDGKYVVGTPGLGMTEGFIWDAAGGSRSIATAEGVVAHDAVGIGYRTYGAQQEIVVFGNSTGGTPGPTYWISSDGGFSFGPKLRRTDTKDVYIYPAANAVAGTSADVWYDVWSNKWDTAAGSQNVYIEEGSGAPALPAQGPKGVTSETRLLGVSSTGLAVGWRKEGNPIVPRNYVLQWAGPTTPGAIWVNGLQADSGGKENRSGQLWAISLNSDTIDNRAGGMSPVSDGRAGNWPFVVDDFTADDTGTAAELPTFNPSFGSDTNGIVYGLSADGRYAVGMDFTLGKELAVLWDLADLGNIVEVDLTQFAIDNGILNDFAELNRAYSVGVNASGQPVVAGKGYDGVENATRGFVLTIPEPVSVAFLTLGGLPLLWRRRR